MKKRSKITLRTKIYLTIAALLTLTGVFYASNPTVFVSPGHGVDTPIGLAADPTHLFLSQYNDNDIKLVDCNGNGSLFGNVLPNFDLVEKYMAMAPSQSANAGFTPRDVLVTQGPLIFKIHEGNVTLFATIQCGADDHNGITFDHVGTFGRIPLSRVIPSFRVLVSRFQRTCLGQYAPSPGAA